MVWASTILMGLITLTILALALRRLFKGPRFLPAEGLQLLAWLPAAPSLPGLVYLFPGRGTPPDPDTRESAITFVDTRPKAPLPAGIRSTETDK